MTPILRFPVFRRLEIGDRALIEEITRRFPPYSDFGFTSLWSWNTDQRCALSMLGANLVVRFTDYGSGAHFLSFLGQDAVIETAGTLLDHARDEGLQVQLKLIPDVVIAADDCLWERFSVALDRDNFDYLHAVDAWAHFLHPGFREHRRKVVRLRERVKLDVHSLEPADPDCQDAMIGLFHRWAEQKPPLPGEDRQHELSAMRRLFALTHCGQLAARGVHDGERLIGFSIWEGLPGGSTAVIHFQKAERDYRGLSSWQAQDMGRVLLAQGYRLINFEQDLGIVGLREYKRSLQPCRYLRKYVIAERGGRGDAR